MLSSGRSRLLAITLRLGSAGVKFGFVFVLAFFLPVEIVGKYGLAIAIIAFAVYAIGFDFYTYANRELVRQLTNGQGRVLRSQMTMALFSYLLILPIALLLLFSSLISPDLFLWFLVLVPLEQAAAELERILITRQDNLLASFALAVRQAAAPIASFLIFVLNPHWRRLEPVFISWILFDLVAITICLFFMRGERATVRSAGTDWRWIGRGLRSSCIFFAGTLVLRSLFTVDRQFVAAFSNFESLGAYTLYISVAGGITVLVNASVHQFLYPLLLHHAHNKKPRALLMTWRKLGYQTVLAGGVAALLVMLAIPALVSHLPDPVYLDFLWLLPWALAAVLIYNLALIPHFLLYALHKDWWIFSATFFAGAMFFLVLLIPIKILPVTHALTALTIASSCLLVVKWVIAHGSYRAWRNQTNNTELDGH